MTTPVGNWWAGVTKTAASPASASASTRIPCSSTGTPTQESPATVSCSRSPVEPGSSTPTRSMPRPSSTSATSRLAWPKPLTTTI